MSGGNDWASDLAFLKRHTDPVILGVDQPGRVAVIPEYQCRAMTSTTGHPDHSGFGWINYPRVAAGPAEGDPNLFGGEDRFWLAPEGSRHSLYFDPGQPLDFAHWRIPRALNGPRFELVAVDSDSVEMTHRDTVTSWSGQSFDFQVRRRVVLQRLPDIETALGMAVDPSIWSVGFRSENWLTNCGPQAWTRETGMPAIWILGMFKPAPAASMLIPLAGTPGDGEKLPVTVDYFGIPEPQRMIVDRENRLVCFRGDGRFRSKLGVPAGRARDLLGAWDPHQQRLTVVRYSLPRPIDQAWTNNLWRTDIDPYCGDVANVYNDGPNESGNILGPFFELESLSPGLSLQPNETGRHVHTTIHLQGQRNRLDGICQSLFGVSTDQIDRLLRGPRFPGQAGKPLTRDRPENL